MGLFMSNLLVALRSGILSADEYGNPTYLPPRLSSYHVRRCIVTAHLTRCPQNADGNYQYHEFNDLSIQAFAPKMLATTQFHLVPSELEYLRHRVPFLRRTLSNYSGSTMHPHSVAAIERNLAEHMCYLELRKFAPNGVFVDIGGNSNRHTNYGRHDVWSCKPLLYEQDVLRNRYSRTGGFCDHRVEECTCVQPDGYMSVHSLYSFSPADVLQLVLRSNQRILAAAVHRFRHGAGLLCGGQIVYRRKPGGVTCSATGNSFSYTHGDCEWLERGYYSDGHAAMAWGLRHEYGDTLVYVFMEAPVRDYRLEDGPINLDTAISTEMYFGQTIDAAEELQIGSRYLAQFKVNIRNVRRFRGMFYVDGAKTKDISIPIAIVRAAARYIVGKPRNALTWANLNSHLRNVATLEHVDNPLLEIDKAIMYGAAIGFLLNIKEETSLLFYINRRLSRLALHETLLSFKPVSLHRLHWWFWTFLLFAITAIVVIGTGAAGYHTWPLMLMPIFLFFHDNPKTPDYYQQAVDLYRRYKLSSRFGRNTIINKTFNLDAHRDERVVEVPQGITIKDLGVDEGAEAAVRHVGVAFTNCVPLYFDRSANNILLSLAMRVAPCADAQPNPALWTELRANQDIILATLNIDVLWYPFDVWVTRYPRAIADVLTKAHKIIGNARLEKIHVRRTGFIKYEARANLSDHMLEDKIPRLIQSATPAFNARVGPSLYSVGQNLKACWNGRRPYANVFYPSGADAVSIGEWYNRHYEPGDALADNDATKFDRGMTKPALEAEQDWLEHRQVPNDVLDAIQLSWETVGYTKFWKYSLEGGRKSGDQHTSSGNTFTNVSMHLYVFAKVLSTATGSTLRDSMAVVLHCWRVIALGDDVFIILKGPLKILAQHNAAIVALFRQLGFVVKLHITIRPHEVGFCSGYFVPVKVDGNETHILAPKPGRLLYKMGYADFGTRVVDYKGHMRGVALGLMPSCSWHPILGPFLKRIVDITSKHEVIRLNPHQHAIFRTTGHTIVATSRTHEFVANKYNWNEQSQKIWDGLVAQIAELPCLTQTSVLNDVFDSDLQ
nr:MAG: RNA-dependent RNA polymerase [Chemarfal virus 144]